MLPGVTVEVSSPALIEKVRTAVSDSQGRYQVVDLRPGSYAVTFTLPGFSSVKREGIELTSGFTATVNAELRVGAIAETVTVSGASPVVDTQNVLQQTVLTRQVLDAIPATKTVQSHAALTVGAAVPPNRQDVGGSTGEFTSAVAIHGIGGNESITRVDGVSVQAMIGTGGGGSRWLKANQLMTQEVAADRRHLRRKRDRRIRRQRHLQGRRQQLQADLARQLRERPAAEQQLQRRAACAQPRDAAKGKTDLRRRRRLRRADHEGPALDRYAAQNENFVSVVPPA